MCEADKKKYDGNFHAQARMTVDGQPPRPNGAPWGDSIHKDRGKKTLFMVSDRCPAGYY